MNTSGKLFAATLGLAALVAVFSLSPVTTELTGANQAALQAATQSAVVNVTDATFAAEVANSSTPVIIDMNADWCGPCRAMAPHFAAVSNEYVGKVKFVSVDTDANPKIPTAFGVRGIPNIVVVKKDAAGNLVYVQYVGYRDSAGIRKLLNEALDAKTVGKPVPTIK